MPEMAAMHDTGLANGVPLFCVICCGAANNPQPWPGQCGHFFCLDCSLELIQCPEDEAVCPLCRKDLPMCRMNIVAMLLSRAIIEESELDLMIVNICPMRFERGMCIELTLPAPLFKSIVEDCSGSHRRFGVVAGRIRVGSFGRVAEVRYDEKHVDESCKVRIVGRQRFKVLRLADGSTDLDPKPTRVYVVDELPEMYTDGPEILLPLMTVTCAKDNLKRGSLMSLTLKEPQNRRMVERVWAADRRFGVVLQKPISVGGTGRIVGITKYDSTRVFVRVQEAFSIRRLNRKPPPGHSDHLLLDSNVVVIEEEEDEEQSCNNFVNVIKQFMLNLIDQQLNMPSLHIVQRS